MTEHPDDESVLRDRLRVLSRQRWIVLLAVTVVPLVAVMASHMQQQLYQGSARVLVDQHNATAQALNLSAAVTAPPDRYAATQAKLARVGTVARMAVHAAKLPGHTAPTLLASSSVSADPLADLLTFSVTDPSPTVAMTLANAYAQQFTRYRHKLDNAALSAAIADARRKINMLVRSGEGGSQLSRRLAATEGDLEELQTLQAAGSSASMVGPALSASLVQPQTKRNVLLGVIVGLALGIALAFIRESLDTRVRSADELRARLGLPLLGQVPKPDRRLAESRQLATLTEPTSSISEAFRILKNKLEMLQLEYHVGSVVITSPLEDEDKSTTAANLAVTLAQSGRHVILVDLNLRDPTVHQLFGLDDRHGFTHVAIGGVDVTDALNVVGLYTHKSSAEVGVLEVVTAGFRPRDAGEFVLSSYVPEALAVLAERCDLLLTVTPPVLAVGDAMTIAKHTDAVMLVAGVNRVHRDTLVETRHVLDACPVMKLGVIATGGYTTERSGYPPRVSAALTRMRSDYAEREGPVAAPSGGHGSKPAKRFFPAISARVASDSAVVSAKARRNGQGSEVRAGARAASRRDREDGPQQVPDV